MAVLPFCGPVILPRLGARHILGGSVATVVATGTSYDDNVGTPYPIIIVSCPDFSDGLIRLVGRATAALGPETTDL